MPLIHVGRVSPVADIYLLSGEVIKTNCYTSTLQKVMGK
jgi:hypothetical protein